MMQNEELGRIIEERIRPQLAEHGGNLEVVSIKDGVLTVRLLGHCSGCPSANITAEQIIKKEIMEKIPEITDVVLDDGISEDMMAFARKLMGK